MRLPVPGALAVALALTACSDRAPALPEPSSAAPLAAFRCAADVRAATLECVSADPATGAARGDVILGGQGTFVRLSSDSTWFDGVELRSRVVLQNLLSIPMGTTDGYVAAREPIRVFFASGPTVVEGDGEALVQGAGTDAFTASDQLFYRYEEVLAPQQRSAPKEWVFLITGSYTKRFEFTVYVSAVLPFEEGGVQLMPIQPTVKVGGGLALAATVRDPLGRPLPGEPEAWRSSDTLVARVSDAGVVTGVAPGRATVYAYAGARWGMSEVTVVSGAGDVLPPQLTGLRLTDSVFVAGRPDTAWIELDATDDSSGVASFDLGLHMPLGGPELTAEPCVRIAGSDTAGTWRCAVVVPAGSPSGAWAVEGIGARDAAGNGRGYTSMVAAFWPVYVHVVGG